MASTWSGPCRARAGCATGSSTWTTGCCRRLLRRTVRALQAEIPGLGETVAFDVKHIYAWVPQNNPKAYVPDRYNPARQPTGDPDCRLGVKTSSNQVRPDGTTKADQGVRLGLRLGRGRGDRSRATAMWSSPSTPSPSTRWTPPTIIPSTPAPCTPWASVPTNVTADAAFDAWHIYQTCAAMAAWRRSRSTRGAIPPPQRRPTARPCAPPACP